MSLVLRFGVGVHAGQVLDVSVEPLLSVKPVDDREILAAVFAGAGANGDHEAGTFAGFVDRHVDVKPGEISLLASDLPRSVWS
jgi:hypothetical protein